MPDKKSENKTHNKTKNKAHTKARIKDVKKLLLANIITDDKGELTVGGDFHINLQGPVDGTLGTVMLGIASMEESYEAGFFKNEKKALYQGKETMKKIGRVVKLPSVEMGHAVLIRHFFFRPVALVFEKKEDGRMALTSYCGRALLSFFSMRHAMGLFLKNAPEYFLKDPKNIRMQRKNQAPVK